MHQPVIDPTESGALEKCDECGTRAARRGEYFAVHFPSLSAQKPCPRSWPPAPRGRK